MYKLFGIVIILMLSIGCARTVSIEQAQQKTPKLHLKLTFEENTGSDTIYVIVFSKSASPNIFFQPNTNELAYMPLPGFDFNTERLQNTQGIIPANLKPFYDQIYKTWEQFIIIYDNKIELFQGPFTATNNIGNLNEQRAFHIDNYQKNLSFRGQISSIEGNNTLQGLGSSKILNLNLEIDQLGYQENDLIYYGILTLKKEDIGIIAGTYQDASRPKNLNISFLIRLQKNNSDQKINTNSLSVNKGADLKEWFIEVL